MIKLLLVLSMFWWAGCTQQEEIKPITEFRGLPELPDSLIGKQARILENFDISQSPYTHNRPILVVSFLLPLLHSVNL